MLSTVNRPKKNSSPDIIVSDDDSTELMNFDVDPSTLGTVVNTFSFGASGINENSEISNSEKPEKNVSDDSKSPSPKGLTTPIDGELFNIKRSYQFRESTLRKLTELKVKDSDINIYLNQILDKAICFYYDYVVNKKS